MKQKWMAALLALCLLASLCACGGKTPADETPDRPDTEQTGSASPGETTGDTDCAHEQLTANVTQPTCTQAGSVVYTCDNCGAAVRTTPLPAMNHSYRWEDDDSGHWQVCAICGDKTASAAHTLQNGVCTVCGHQTGQSGGVHHTHAYKEQVTAATCTAGGYTTHTCACGRSYTDSFTPALGHRYTAAVTTAATCTEAGVRTYTCTVCGDSFTEVIPAAGHRYADGICTVCGAADPNAPDPAPDPEPDPTPDPEPVPDPAPEEPSGSGEIVLPDLDE